MQIVFRLPQGLIKQTYSFAKFTIIKSKFIIPTFEATKPPLKAIKLFEQEYCVSKKLLQKSLRKDQKDIIKQDYESLSAEEKQKFEDQLKQRKIQYKENLSKYKTSTSPPPRNAGLTKILRHMAVAYPTYTIQQVSMKLANIKMGQMKVEEKEKLAAESKEQKAAYCEKYQLPTSKKLNAYSMYAKEKGFNSGASYTKLTEEEKQIYLDKAIKANQEIEDQWQQLAKTYQTTKQQILEELARQEEINTLKSAKLALKKKATSETNV